jgi:glucose-6-phosphate isomerase
VIADGPVRFGRVARCLEGMAAVLLDPGALPPATELYWTLPLLDAGPAAGLMARTGLTYSGVLLPPLSIGRELVKTQGHYHPAMPGSEIAYPEVYTHLWGEPLLLMQRRRNGHADQIDDCVLIEMRDGASVTIPPGYAHIVINPSNRPALIAGLYSQAFAPLYDAIVAMAGAAYYVIDDAGGETALANPKYADAPPPQRMCDITGTAFAPPDGNRPLWTSFLADPDRYAFLAEPDAARRRFPTEGDA